MRWIRSLEETAPGRGLDEPLVWLVPPGSADEAAARPTREDLTDAASLGPHRGAERLLRRRLTRALAAVAFGVDPASVRFLRAEDGTQSLVGPASAYCSAAGRDGWSVVALGLRPIGVDLEWGAVEAPLPTDLFSTSEQRALALLPIAERAEVFARLWVAKEAWAKVTGASLEAVLKSDITQPAQLMQANGYIIGALELAS